MSVDLQRLIHLEAVHRLGSFSHAAEELGRTQPTISRSIAYLEARWGVRLFDREPGGVIPTRIGMDLIADVERLLAQAKVIDHNMNVRAKGRAGCVEFGIAPLIGAIVTARAIAAISRSAPELIVKARVEPLADLIAHLKRGETDFAIFSETLLPDEPELQFRKIGAIPLKIVARSGHPIGQLVRPGVEHLAAYPFASTTYLRDMDFLPQPSVICDNYAIVEDIVIESECLWFTSPLIVKEEIDAGLAEVISLADDKLPAATDLYLAHRTGKMISPAAASVLSKLLDELNLLCDGDDDRSQPGADGDQEPRSG